MGEPFFKNTQVIQFVKYCLVGGFNVLMNAVILNTLIFTTGIQEGPMLTFFILITFSIVVTQSFFLNVFWTFRESAHAERRSQYVRFIAVSGTSALVSAALFHALVVMLGAPFGIHKIIWANIALLCTVLVSLCGNFVGYKLFVFRAPGVMSEK